MTKRFINLLIHLEGRLKIHKLTLYYFSRILIEFLYKMLTNYNGCHIPYIIHNFFIFKGDYYGNLNNEAP